mgnify:CR=1 FL=1
MNPSMSRFTAEGHPNLETTDCRRLFPAPSYSCRREPSPSELAETGDEFAQIDVVQLSNVIGGNIEHSL